MPSSINYKDLRVGMVVWVQFGQRPFRSIVVEPPGQTLPIVVVPQLRDYATLSIYPEYELWESGLDGDATVVREARSDGYVHYGIKVSDAERYVVAGCRIFTSFREAEEHWRNRKRVAPYRPDSELNNFSLFFSRDVFFDEKPKERSWLWRTFIG